MKDEQFFSEIGIGISQLVHKAALNLTITENEQTPYCSKGFVLRGTFNGEELYGKAPDFLGAINNLIEKVNANETEN